MLMLFIVSVLFLLYTFIIYPLFMDVKTTKEYVPAMGEYEEPITIILSVFNGEKLVEERINNIFGSRYPQDIIKMIVVSDGSTDGTEKKLAEIAEQESRLTYIHYPVNKGKAFAVSEAMKQVQTSIVGFCDIRQEFDPYAIALMVTRFKDESVGAVTGNLVIKQDQSNQKAEPGFYWKYEKWIRENEGHYDSLLGVTGAIYCARTSLYPKEIPQNTILDDMYVPMSIIKKGYKVKMSSDAVAYDIPSATLQEEFMRKVRTLAGNFQLMKLHPWVNNPFGNRLYFQWMSHKVARLFVPYAILGVLISTSLGNTPFLNFAFCAQWFFYLYTMVGYLAMNRNSKILLGGFCVSFCSLNIAAFLAGWKYLFSPVEKLWQKH